jgi:hypothetical protein
LAYFAFLWEYWSSIEFVNGFPYIFINHLTMIINGAGICHSFHPSLPLAKTDLPCDIFLNQSTGMMMAKKKKWERAISEEED